MIKADLQSGTHGNTVFLAGHPGIGKTSIVKQIAKDWASKCFVVSVNLLADKADLTGARLVKSDDGSTFEQRFFAHHKVRQAVNYAEENPNMPVILLLDEINRANSDVTSGALSISTERELGESLLPANLYVMATGNTKGNVVALDSASISRFVIYNIEADANSLIKYLDSRDDGNRPLNPWVKAVLTTKPHTVFQHSMPESYSVVDGQNEDDPDTMSASFADLMDAGEEMLQLTTPRTIEGVSNWLDAISEGGTNMAPLAELLQTSVEVGTRETTQLNEVLEAHVGNTDFTTYLVQEIAGAISTPQQNQTGVAGPTAACPPVWKKLKDAATQTDLDNLVSQMSENEKSASILYALFDNSDNSIILAQLLAQTTELEKEHQGTLGKLFAASRINEANKLVAIGQSGPISNRIEQFSSLFN